MAQVQSHRCRPSQGILLSCHRRRRFLCWMQVLQGLLPSCHENMALQGSSVLVCCSDVCSLCCRACCHVWPLCCPTWPRTLGNICPGLLPPSQSSKLAGFSPKLNGPAWSRYTRVKTPAPVCVLLHKFCLRTRCCMFD